MAATLSGGIASSVDDKRALIHWSSFSSSVTEFGDKHAVIKKNAKPLMYLRRDEKVISFTRADEGEGKYKKWERAFQVE